MWSSREAFENDFCPVREDLFGEMYRANEGGLPRLVESVSSDDVERHRLVGVAANAALLEIAKPALGASPRVGEGSAEPL